MRRFLLATMFSILSCGIGAGGACAVTDGPVTFPLPPAQGVLPGAEAFFETIGIRIPPGERAQFIVGDNLAGYYEGYTHAFSGGDGYRMKAVTLFLGHASFVDGRLLDRRTQARADLIQPYGHRAIHAGAVEELLLHSGRYALSLRIGADAPAELAALPLWNLPASGYAVETADGTLLLTPRDAPDDGIPRFIAVSADQPFRVQGSVDRIDPVRTALDLDAAALAPVIASAAPTTRFTVHIAFGFSRDEALAKARALAATDSWNRELAAVYARLTTSHLWTSDVAYNRALVWAKASAYSFVVEEFGKGLWAGLPWFRDNWGRDTFIALPGTLLVSGLFDDARAVLDNFARYQKLGALDDPDYGRVPNRVAAGDSIIYNTVDGTPWMIREALEYLRYSGDADYAEAIAPLIREYVKGAREHFVDAEGLLTHDAADTWMDARIAGDRPWSARGNRAVEIQALWHTALQVGAQLSRRRGDVAEAERYDALAAQVQRHFLARFWDGAIMADRVRADGRRDTKLRPNQLMLVSIPFAPFVPEAVEARITRNAVSALLYPYGIASLDPRHPYFHPRHENPAFHHKDAAYHNGTVWGWNAGFTVTALTKFGYQDLAWTVTRNLADQILDLGTRGSMSELLDALPAADGTPHPSGTYAQAWSVAEFARNAYQDYLGFRPDLLDSTLAFVPALPSAWTRVQARLPYGDGEALELRLAKAGDTWTWRFQPGANASRQVRLDLLTRDKSRHRVRFALAGTPRVLTWDGRAATLDGAPLSSQPVMASQAHVLGDLRLATPPRYAPEDFPVLRGKDVLQTLILEGKFE